MDDREFGEPAVFVVTVRPGSGPDEVRGSIAPVAPAGSPPATKRWFRALDQIPAILRSFLGRHGGADTDPDNRRTP